MVDHYKMSISQLTMDLSLFTQMFSVFYHCQDYCRLFYKKQELLTLCEHMSSPPCLVGPYCSFVQFFVVVLLCFFTFCVPCCDVRYDFHIKRWSVFTSSCLQDVCLMSHLRYLCLLAHSGVQHILCCVFALSSFCVPYVSPSVFSIVQLIFCKTQNI